MNKTSLKQYLAEQARLAVYRYFLPVTAAAKFVAAVAAGKDVVEIRLTPQTHKTPR